MWTAEWVPEIETFFWQAQDQITDFFAAKPNSWGFQLGLGADQGHKGSLVARCDSVTIPRKMVFSWGWGWGVFRRVSILSEFNLWAVSAHAELSAASPQGSVGAFLPLGGHHFIPRTVDAVENDANHGGSKNLGRNFFCLRSFHEPKIMKTRASMSSCPGRASY